MTKENGHQVQKILRHFITDLILESHSEQIM